ncbi:Peptide methionine sulfoxide reductase [Gryllus bimaculatus]|nr:Peptide methionine sulfoxide reductase [Gryllus bimaculatus]
MLHIGRCGPVLFVCKHHFSQKMANLLHDLNVNTKKATLAMGCFWGPDSLYGATKGVVRTRVGYSGGEKPCPTYRSIGDHTESIDIDYNPDEISYSELLNLFWANHDPTLKTKPQYTSLIFYHDNEQKQIAEESLKEQERLKEGVVTRIIPFKEFYNAEDYHQKYRLQQYPQLMEAIGITKGSTLLIDSHLAARLNGYVVGFGGVNQFNEEVGKFGLDEKTIEDIRDLVIKYEGVGMTC